MGKYEELKEQVLTEIQWLIDDINNELGLELKAEELTLDKYIGNESLMGVNLYQKGMLFAYLSIKSKIDSLEEES